MLERARLGEVSSFFGALIAASKTNDRMMRGKILSERGADFTRTDETELYSSPFDSRYTKTTKRTIKYTQAIAVQTIMIGKPTFVYSMKESRGVPRSRP